MITSISKLFSTVQDVAHNDAEAVAVLTVLFGSGRVSTLSRRRPAKRSPARR